MKLANNKRPLGPPKWVKNKIRMEEIEKYIEFLHNSFPSQSKNNEWFDKMSQFSFSKISGIKDWWYKCSEEFCRMSGTGNSSGLTLYSYIKSCQYTESKVKEDIIDEFKSYDKDLRILTYKILLEKFNTKYTNLHESQKQVLKEFITSVDSTPKLRTFYNTKIQELKTELTKLSKNITDKAVQIKLNEVLPLIVEVEKTTPIKNDNIIDLLQYCELVEELKKANGKVQV